MWECNSRKTLFTQCCGGGHRSWDFNLISNIFIFSYVKNNAICYLEHNWHDLRPIDLLCGFHSLETNAIEVVHIPSNDEYILISGGEDTTLRLSKIIKDCPVYSFVNINVLKMHLSSIRTIAVCQICLNDNSARYLFFSAGGRAQVVMTELVFSTPNCKINSLICTEKHSFYEPLEKEVSEIRVMDLTHIKVGDKVILFAACSDGKIKVFICEHQLQTLKSHMQLLSTLSYKLKCIVKICNIVILGRNLLITMGTDGKIVFWDITEVINMTKNSEFKCTSSLDVKPLYSINGHQSGINSYSYKIVQNNKLVFVTGGDDNAIVVHLLNLEIHKDILRITVLNKYFDISSHCAQITGAYIGNDYFVTASIDQKVLFFHWEIKSNAFQCDLVGRYNTTVSDIQGIKVFEDDGLNVLVYGKGFEILHLSDINV